MKCLCCGKEIKDGAAAEERNTGWHLACIRKFFGTKSIPEMDISADRLRQIALESAGRGYTVTGVQKKMSLHLAKDTGRPRLTLVNYPSGFILKPQTETWPALPEAEFLVMQMAKQTGIAVVPFALLHDVRSAFGAAYITRRIDRILPADGVQDVKKLAMEDFCQLEQRLTENKYKGSYERCAKVISRYSIRPGMDLSELFMRIVFSFAAGNSDMHLKNFSMIETFPGSGKYVLSPAYDLLPVSIILPDDEETALTLNGKKHNIRRKDFLVFAGAAGIRENAAVKMLGKIISMKDIYMEMCRESYLPDDMKERLIVLIGERISILAGRQNREEAQ